MPCLSVTCFTLTQIESKINETLSPCLSSQSKTSNRKKNSREQTSENCGLKIIANNYYVVGVIIYDRLPPKPNQYQQQRSLYRTNKLCTCNFLHDHQPLWVCLIFNAGVMYPSIISDLAVVSLTSIHFLADSNQRNIRSERGT